jgi:hypothetical protein
MPFILKKNIKRTNTNENFKNITIPKTLTNNFIVPNSVPNKNAKLIPFVCDKDIYKMSYNMETIKKRVHQLFIHPDTTCHYFASIGITNLNLTTYNEVIHEQAKICFKILGDFESSHKITYAVFAGNSIGLLRAGNNLPWADDYDIILFKHDIAVFTSHIVPELERIGFKIKPKIVNGIACGAKIFGPPVSFTHTGDKYQSISIFQCDVFYSYFDGNGFLKNCGGWGLYHQKNIPRSVVFPLKRHQFHGMLLPFFNDPLKEAELCYGGDIQKCAIFSHHLDSTIFYKRWQHAYKDFDHIKKTSIINTRQYIRNGLAPREQGNGDMYDETTNKTLSLSSSDVCDMLFHGDECNDFHISVSKKLDFLRHLHENSIGIIVISPLTKQRCKTHFALEDLKHKKKIDAADYNYIAPGLKFIGDHAADIKYYFPYIKIIYQESADDALEYALSPLFYGYIDVMRVTRMRYEQVYQNHLNAAAKYGMVVPTVEIIESD